MQKVISDGSLVYAFESDRSLATMPLAARRALDVLGRRLSLQGWLSLNLDERRRIVHAGAEEKIDGELTSVVDAATPAPAVIPAIGDPDSLAPPPALLEALGPSRPLRSSAWKGLRSLDRYALVKCASRPDKLARAYDAIVGGAVLSHLRKAGEAHMVGVGGKHETLRRAVASARVRTTRAVVELVASGEAPKGDVLAVARVAGIMAAKKTPDLVPLCHPVRVTGTTIDLELDVEKQELRVRATVEALDRTGVEMEALTAATIASLTVYDMIKSADRWATIEAVQLEAKSGGKSGEVTRPPVATPVAKKRAHD
jgi:cyclic pyranopterin phosphate synthase